MSYAIYENTHPPYHHQHVESTAVYVVDSGALEVCTSGGETVIARLLAGDFCGEVSVLFDVKCTARVQTECSSTLLAPPTQGCASGLYGWRPRPQ